jgi:photosystem II stability/assembly factor-like uncharacterized protein
VDGGLLVGTHTGVVRVDVVSGAVTPVGASRDDFMGLAGSSELLVASGHPGVGSLLPDPVGFIRSTDGAETWETVSLTGEIDFHSLAIDGDQVAGSATAGELLYSADGGATWSTIAQGEATSLAWFDGRLWIADGSSLATWGPGDAAPQTVPDAAGVFVAAASDASLLWVLRPDGSLLASADGVAWTPAGSVDEAASLAASPTAAYVVTPDRIQVIPAPA